MARDYSTISPSARQLLLVRAGTSLPFACDRGGWWITADVYICSVHHLYREPHVQRFLDTHRVDERKFAGWAAAEDYFQRAGFAIARRRAPSNDPWRERETWTLALA